MREGIEVKKVNVTPELAQRWLLQHNTHNRPLYEKVVDRYALDMKRGDWVLNHQGICFDDEGTLIDGQHRLHAVIRSGQIVNFYIFRNMPKIQGENGGGIVTQNTIDMNKTRGIGDQLHLSYGIENANVKAAMVVAIVMISIGVSSRLSMSMTSDIYNMFKSEIDIVVENRGTQRGLTNASSLGAFAFAAVCFRDKTIEFEKGYFSGENLQKHSPILCFRNYMINRTALKGRTDYARYTIASHALNCLMHHILGNSLKRLVSTNQGIDFFRNKQKKVYTDLIELLKL